jgi:hypothetical protein
VIVVVIVAIYFAALAIGAVIYFLDQAGVTPMGALLALIVMGVLYGLWKLAHIPVKIDRVAEMKRLQRISQQRIDRAHFEAKQDMKKIIDGQGDNWRDLVD